MGDKDYKGSIEWAHHELDVWGAPRQDETGLELTVSGRINRHCATLASERQEHEKHLAKITQALQELIDYRNRNTLNFQLEKLDDQIRELTWAVTGETPKGWEDDDR